MMAVGKAKRKSAKPKRQAAAKKRLRKPARKPVRKKPAKRIAAARKRLRKPMAKRKPARGKRLVGKKPVKRALGKAAKRMPAKRRPVKRKAKKRIQRKTIVSKKIVSVPPVLNELPAEGLCNEEAALSLLDVYFSEIARHGVKRRLSLDEVIDAYFYALLRIERKGIEMNEIKGILEKGVLKKSW